MTGINVQRPYADPPGPGQAGPSRAGPGRAGPDRAGRVTHARNARLCVAARCYTYIGRVHRQEDVEDDGGGWVGREEEGGGNAA